MTYYNNLNKKSKLRIIRYLGNESITVYCTFAKLDETVDYNTAGAVRRALDEMIKENCIGISASFNGMQLQVNID